MIMFQKNEVFLGWIVTLVGVAGMLTVVTMGTHGLFPTPQPAQAAGIVEYKGQKPSDLPAFPEYPGATVDVSRRKIDLDKKGYTINWNVAGEPQAIAKYYQQALAQDGWMVETPFEWEEGVFELFTVVKKGPEKVYLTIELSEENHDVVEIIADFVVY